MMRHNPPAVIVAAFMVLACAPAFAQGGSGLVPGGAPPDVALVFTGDTIGYIEPCG